MRKISTCAWFFACIGSEIGLFYHNKEDLLTIFCNNGINIHLYRTQVEILRKTCLVNLVKLVKPTVPAGQRGARRQLFALILPVLIVFTMALSACGPGLPGASDEEAGADAEGAGILYAGPADADAPNADLADASASDGGALDADTSESGTPDTNTPDANTPDADLVDANAPDASEEAQTEPFQDFLAIMSQRGQTSCTETGAGGYTYKLDCGSLSVSGADGAGLWRSDASWWVDGFRLGDVDGDGAEDFVFSLWKSFRFGKASPSRMGNDDETVRNHLFVYTVLSGHIKPIWGSSDLPCPIYSFELDPSGRVTPVSSGMLLKTCEGEYRDDFSQTETTERVYAWEKWGFVPIE